MPAPPIPTDGRARTPRSEGIGRVGIDPAGGDPQRSSRAVIRRPRQLRRPDAAIRSAASGRAHARAAAAIASRRRSSSSTSDRMARRERRWRQVGVEQQRGGAGGHELAGVRLLVVLGGVRVRHEDRRARAQAASSATLAPARATARSAIASARSIRSMNGTARTMQRGVRARPPRARRRRDPGPVLTSSWRSARSREQRERAGERLVEVQRALAAADDQHRACGPASSSNAAQRLRAQPVA